jgi:hypothetical protein
MERNHERGSALQFVLDVSRDQVGRLRGQATWDGGAQASGFSGTLELLRILEDHTELGFPSVTPEDEVPAR